MSDERAGKEQSGVGASAACLRDSLIERWFDIDDDNHEVTDEQILARIEDLVGEGWHHAGLESERAESFRLALQDVQGIALNGTDVAHNADERLDAIDRRAEEALPDAQA